MNFGGILRGIRTNEKMNVTDFADKIDISRTYLSDLEHNRKSPSLNTAEKIANKLGLTLAELLSKK